MRSLRRPLLGLTLSTIALAVPALAQTGGGYPAACDASKVTKADVDRAHTVYLSGKGFLDESNYDKAISYFKDAYSIDCSVHGILPIIATAYERKGDKASAVGALQEYLKRAPNASDREVVERRIKNLQDQMGPATTASTAPAVSSSATAAPVPSATAAPTATSTATTTAAPTATATSEPTPSGGHSIPPWIVVGVGGAAVATGVVLYIVGSGQVSDAEGQCGSDHKHCPAGAAGQNAINEGNSGRNLENVAVIVGAAGLAVAAGGLAWHFLEPTGSSGSASVTPVVTPGYGGVAFQGRF